MTKLRSSKSGYRGVSPYNQKWRAEIRYQGWRVASPSFDNPVVAALIRDECARRLFGEDTYVNFPNKQVANEYLSIVVDMVFRALNVAKSDTGF
jgi:hypothetical protein